MDNIRAVSLSAILFLVLSLSDIVSGELCTEVYRYKDTAKARTFHCSFGCCGPDFDQYCCVSHAGVIVGIVFACIFGVAFIATCVCCCIKHHGARARLVRPSAGVDGAAPTSQTNVFIVPHGTGPPAYATTFYNPYYRGPEVPSGTPGAGGAPPMVAYPPLPPAYDAASAPPPAYSSPAPPPGYNDVTGINKAL